eukprot:3431995-Amphidinium_carterae.1
MALISAGLNFAGFPGWQPLSGCRTAEVKPGAAHGLLKSSRKCTGAARHIHKLPRVATKATTEMATM